MEKLLAAMLWAGLMALPAVTHACSPPLDYRERRQDYEDQALRRATILFRGTIENLQFPQGPHGDVTMVIRKTRTFWGRGAPERVVIPSEYFSNCPRGNLDAAVSGFGDLPGLPLVRNGLGVTLIGAVEDAVTPWAFIILVDHAPDTQRVLRRFRQLNGYRRAP